MSLTAFNSSAFPSVSPWACFTFEWFDVLMNDRHIRDGIYYSFIIGIGTVALSVSMGLAASIVLTQVWPKLRPTYYTMIIAPILIPGVVLGISTLVFWDRVSQFIGATDGTFLHGLFHNGIFLTILGQSSFIASYAMLVFVARLQRFDPGLTEAALDLGATHTQAFRKILLPFMRPAIASASVLAFLASFENYNTTTFTIIDYKTLTTVLAQKVRLGINPSISSLAFIIIVLTIFAALAFEATQRNKQRREAVAQGKAPATKKGIIPPFFRGNVAAVALVLLAFVVIVMIGTAQSYSPKVCKQQVYDARQIEIQKRIEELNKARAKKAEQQSTTTTPVQSAPAPSGAFGNVFAPTNLTTEEEKPKTEAPKAGSGAFGNVFAPTNLNADD
jgi:spermidine/putrescine transport system permease protein